MVSGSWGLCEFQLGNRGFLYYRPDWGLGEGYEDKSLPVLGAWQPAGDQRARQECTLRAYVRNWENLNLPPAMGQWASGDATFLQEAALRVVGARPNEWQRVLERLRQAPEIRDKDPETVERVSDWCKVDAVRVREALHLAYVDVDESRDPASLRQQGLPDCAHAALRWSYWLRRLQAEEGRLLIALYVHCISRGGFPCGARILR